MEVMKLNSPNFSALGLGFADALADVGLFDKML
jgi:hypothetical protein